jgi:hypothetical protein
MAVDGAELRGSEYSNVPAPSGCGYNDSLEAADITSEEESSDDDYSSDGENYNHPLGMDGNLMNTHSEDFLGTVMRPLQHELVDRAMDELYSVFTAPSPAMRSHAGSDGTTASQSGPPASGSVSISGNGNRDRKRHLDDDDISRGGDNGNEDGNRPNKRPRLGDGNPKIRSVNNQKFACPFYKRFPEKYKNFRSCPGPGWDEIHRVK